MLVSLYEYTFQTLAMCICVQPLKKVPSEITSPPQGTCSSHNAVNLNNRGQPPKKGPPQKRKSLYKNTWFSPTLNPEVKEETTDTSRVSLVIATP